MATLTHPSGETLFRPGDVLDGFLNAPPLSRRHRIFLLAALILLTAAPRLLLAWQSTVICDDGYYYLSVARMWQQGQIDAALSYLNLNTYPLILWGLESAGLPAPWSYKLWGVFASCLSVLPLFGWVRRLFNDRAAAVAVILFAVHPEMIELSVEPIREATFWLFFLAAVYVIHRCATSTSRMRGPLAAGLATAAAIYTRSEGWVLLVLAGMWFIGLTPAAVTGPRRAQRIALVFLMIPLFLCLMNVTVLAQHGRWEWGRFGRLPKIIARLQGDAAPRSSQTLPATNHAVNAASRPPIANGNRSDRSLAAATSEYIRRFGRTFEYFNIVLLIAGLLGCRQKLPRRVFAPPILASALVLLGVVALLVVQEDFNGRYFLTPYLLTLPIQTLGLVDLVGRIDDATAPWSISRRRRAQIWSGVAMAVAGLFVSQALTAGHSGRYAQAAWGAQLRAQFGPIERVETDWESGRIGYHAVGKLPHIIYNRFQKPLAGAELIITAHPAPASFRRRALSYGLTEIPLGDAGEHEYSAFVRTKTSFAQKTNESSQRVR